MVEWPTYVVIKKIYKVIYCCVDWNGKTVLLSDSEELIGNTEFLTL
jgi:hypothetical protein